MNLTKETMKSQIRIQMKASSAHVVLLQFCQAILKQLCHVGGCIFDALLSCYVSGFEAILSRLTVLVWGDSGPHSENLCGVDSGVAIHDGICGHTMEI